nr:RNA-directed DNA polymerase, eukaryota [Tanacetum cinerariifolium]
HPLKLIDWETILGAIKGGDEEESLKGVVVVPETTNFPFLYQHPLTMYKTTGLPEVDAIKEEASIKLQHEGHSQHTLTLQLRPASFRCDACNVKDEDDLSTSAASEDVNSLLHFPMSEAFVDPLKLLRSKILAQDDMETTEINQWSHPAHPLILNVEDPQVAETLVHGKPIVGPTTSVIIVAPPTITSVPTIFPVRWSNLFRIGILSWGYYNEAKRAVFVTAFNPLSMVIAEILGSMPIYHMSLFKVPKKVLHRMEFMRSHFFNGAELSSKKSVWVKWKHALDSKDKSGLGVSSLFAINRALMFKWVWHFITQGSSLWARVIKALHGYDGKIGQKVKSCYPLLWLDIIHEVEIFKSHGIDLVSLIHSKLGNGANTSFWEVAWREGSPFKSPFPWLYVLETQKKIDVASKLSHSGLDVLFHRPPRGGVEIQQFEHMKEKVEGCILADMMDRWFWALEGSGEFTITSVRKMIDDFMLSEVSSKTLWINAVPIKVNVHAWKVKLDGLPTRLNISCRGIDIESILCPMCGKEVESTSHIFFTCQISKEILRKISRWKEKNEAFSKNNEDKTTNSIPSQKTDHVGSSQNKKSYASSLNGDRDSKTLIFLDHKESEYILDDESLHGEKNKSVGSQHAEDDLVDDSDVEGVSETFFGDKHSSPNNNVCNSSEKVVEQQSKDHFCIYDVLNKKPNGVAEDSDSSLSYLPGFTPEVSRQENDHRGVDLNTEIDKSSSRLFNHFITSSRLVDAKLEGYTFTWAHPSATKMSKLDRFHVSKGIISLLPSITALCLDRHLSDHRPIILREIHTDYGPIPFCFYHYWFKWDRFDVMVEQAWNYFFHSDTNGLIWFKKKLQDLKKIIRSWIKDKKLQQSGAINSIKEDLIDIDKNLDIGNVSDEILLKRMELTRQLHDINQMEARDYVQKSKIKWAIEGDKNSKFFHGIINKKRSQLSIRNTNPEVVKDVFKDHFATRFKQPAHGWLKLNISFPNRLSTDQVADMDRSILANRLAMVISDLVSDIQSAFFANRQILDGPFILNELLPWCKRKKKKSMIFKVNFAKVYDSVHWDYLLDVLKAFGFGPNWCKLKQGDPLAPYLFILFMESLHISFSRAISDGLFKGIQIQGSMAISHLFYADDAIFIGKWSDSNLDNIVKILKCFFLASGLKINIQKSQVLGVGVPRNIVNQAASLIGCAVMQNPFRYLGVMAGDSMSQKLAWADTVQKLRSWLSKWKVKTLSIGGRLTLLKSVLGASPLYNMSIYKVPKGVLKEMEAI